MTMTQRTILTTLLLSLCLLSFASGQDDRPPVSWVNSDKFGGGVGLSHHTLDSEALGHEVGYVVYLPDGYEADPLKRYPVVFFLHGMGGNESMDAGGFSSLLRRGTKEGWVPPLIAVFPNGGRSGYRGDVQRMITGELIPKIDSDYRTIGEAGSRGLVGFSMGGAGSVWLSLNHPELFSFAGSWGGGLWRVEEEALALAEKNAAQMRAVGFAALLINGDQDRPEAFGGLVEKFTAGGVENTVVTLEDTPHNLGLYYERADEQMLRFIGSRVKKGLAVPADPSAAVISPPEGFDVIISGGRIVDGTGAPWYIADLGIRDGKIVRIGRLAGVEAAKRIGAEGLIVAPGFIDMMGQTASPMIDEAQTAMNLLTQGVTTINAGEGYSAAPLDPERGRSEGWTTMAEYLQLLDLRGLPVNVVQTVGHTQVRRLVMGEVDRKPGEIELGEMKALVREAMEAGAIGLSTALIYPPAVYADTDEIGALAAVAGEFGGGYFTHMRNEGDQLLEAIDEALEIGRKGGTPVHIFHLKAAGRGNWAKMEQAVAKIKAARAAGEQVAADIYPYINNGLGIEALVHPRHFGAGRDAFLAKVDDPALRQEIRAEMESDGGDWENWFKHMGRDWGKLIIGKAYGLRFSKYSGKSLGSIAEEAGADPWELFFDLVKTGAFVLPETMSEENKQRLIREEFISFCTDVGPAGGAGSTNHPRAFGAFPRLLSKYVRDGKVVSLERAVAQASAVAANEIFARDRGRIAEGLAADVIVFDYAKLADRANFAKPHLESEGMRYVLVNGVLVLDDGKLAKARPGRVLRGPGYDRSRRPAAVSTGTVVPELAPIDELASSFLDQHGAPSVSIAVTDGGRLVYARAFGYADVAGRELARPQSRYRIASISKPITSAAIFLLVQEGKLKLDDKIFEILAGYKPPGEDAEIDPRLAEITVLHCLQHSGGWDRDQSFDAMFRSVDFAKALELPPPADQDAVIRNMMAQPLDFDPGTRQAYSNFGYCLLGRVIAKLGGTGDYAGYVKQHILDPAGALGMAQGRSLPGRRLDGEVRYYSPFRGPSVFAESLGRRVPYPYGGWNLEAMDSHGAWVASAIDLARFAVSFDGEGALLKAETREQLFALPNGKIALDENGKRKASCYAAGWRRAEAADGVTFSHGGALAGTSSYIVKRPDGRNWVVLFNTRRSARGSYLPSAIRSELNRILDQVRDWPTHDLFRAPGGE